MLKKILGIGQENNNRTRSIITLVLLLFAMLFVFFFAKSRKNNEDVPINRENHEEEKIDKIQKEEQEKLIISDNKKRDIKVSAPELITLTRNRTLSAKDFGNVTTEYEGFKYVPENNIEIRESFNKILAIRFLPKYAGKVIGDVRTIDSRENIIKKIGSPNYYKDNLLLYIIEDFDVVINLKTKDITAYNNNILEPEIPKKMFDEYEEFRKSGNLREFIPNLTKLNPAYYKYNYNENGLELMFSDIGILFKYSKDKKESGVFVYDNFVTENYLPFKYLSEKQKEGGVQIVTSRISIEEEIKRDERYSKLYDNAKMYTDQRIKENPNNFDKDILISLYRKPKTKDWNEYVNVTILSRNYNFPPTMITETGTVDDLILGNRKIYFSIDNNGIFEYDLIKKSTNRLKIVNEKIRFKKIEKNLLYYNQEILSLNK